MSIENRAYHRDKDSRINNRIKEIREQNNLSRVEFGKMLNFDHVQIKKIEDETIICPLEIVIRCKKVFFVPYSYLFEGIKQNASSQIILKKIDMCGNDQQDKLYTNLFNLILGNIQNNIFDVDNSDIGRRVKELRKQYYRKQGNLAELLRCTPMQISYLERGERYFSVELIQALKKAFNVSYDFLLEGMEKDVCTEILEEIQMLSSEERKHIYYTLLNDLKNLKINKCDN